MWSGGIISIMELRLLLKVLFLSRNSLGQSCNRIKRILHSDLCGDRNQRPNRRIHRKIPITVTRNSQSPRAGIPANNLKPRNNHSRFSATILTVRHDVHFERQPQQKHNAVQMARFYGNWSVNIKCYYIGSIIPPHTYTHTYTFLIKQCVLVSRTPSGFAGRKSDCPTLRWHRIGANGVSCPRARIFLICAIVRLGAYNPGFPYHRTARLGGTPK